MNKKNICKISFMIAMMLTFGISINVGSETAFASSDLKTNQANVQKPIMATSLAIVANPNKYLNKTVKIQATFDKFSTLGLDYNKALRESNKYIGILIKRDDVLDHDIPLSEMKLFLKKELAEKHIDLDSGDKIEITARVFSTALNDPWLDVNKLVVIKKVAKTTANK